MKAGPVRTCLGCGKRSNKELLWRFTASSAGVIVKDDNGVLGGRGAYCCTNKTCLLKLFKNKKRLSRALHAQGVRWDEELQDIFGSE